MAITHSNITSSLKLIEPFVAFSKPKESLDTFKEDYPIAQTILLYRGKQKYKEKEILCMPVDEFLLEIDPKFLFWKLL